MKKHILLGIFSLTTMLFVGDNMAQTPIQRTDSIITNAKIKILRNRRDSLQNIIKIEDAKRNRCIPGVSPERMEKLNDHQDSICLALRSQLVDILLEIKENSPSVTIHMTTGN